MRSRRSPFSPLAVLGVVLVLVGAVGLLRRSGTQETAADEPCAPLVDPGCPSARTADGGYEPEELAAADVCPDAGYLCAALAEEGRVDVRRWVGFDGTLVVHVPEPRHSDPAVALALQRAATAGILAWNGRPYPILVDERGRREAHIQVSWSGGLSGRQIGRAETSWTPEAGLEVVRLVLASNIRPEALRLVAAHEMGHGFGLPHSDEPRDVMYPTNTAVALTSRDYRTLEALYELPDGAVVLP